MKENHIYNLKRIAERSETGKMTHISFYHKLLSAFRGAKVLNQQEVKSLRELIDDEYKQVNEMLDNNS